ncbi:MAG: DUF5054 domain-containing protein [Chloroflexia bacterium]
MLKMLNCPHPTTLTPTPHALTISPSSIVHRPPGEPTRMTPTHPTPGKPPLRKVVVVFKTHFDLGFTDLPDRVMEQYTGPMFRAVMDVMDATASEPPSFRYRWTLPAWPMRQFLHSPEVPESTRAEARALVEDGLLRWHAWPFTTHTAFCGLEDLVRGLHVSRSLSEEFGVWPTGAKQTDVPGHTWILPSLLVRAGVRFLHLGCNPGSHSPHVPRLFWWEGPDGSRLLTFYSPGGYGSPIVPPDDWQLDTWLALQQTVDNVGPQSPEELARIRAEIERAAPGAEAVFGELGDFADALFERPEQLTNLPVVPCDLADTWIHGVGTMPRQVSRVRALRAQILALETQAALADWPGPGHPGSPSGPDFPLARKIAPAIDAAYEQLMLFGEHTWGLDVKSTIKRAFGDDFEPARRTQPYKRLEESWSAKAAYVDRAEQALVPAVEAVATMPQHDPAPAPTASQIPRPAPASSNVLENAHLRVEVDPAAGAIVSLVHKRTGREWVDPSNPEPFAAYRYDLYSASDIAEYLRAYGLFFQDWFVQDFGKTGYPEDSTHLTAYARDFALSGAPSTGSSLQMTRGILHPARLGPMSAPDQQISIDISLPGDLPYLDLEYRITGKVATPLAESAVVPFPLNLPNPTFRLGQVGSVIDPIRHIAPGANHDLWCVDNWLDASDDRYGLGLIPIDMPLVSIGSPGIFAFHPERVPAEPLLYSHLFNTQWGTNFRQWHEGDFTFRVRLVPHAGDWRNARLWTRTEYPVGARHASPSPPNSPNSPNPTQSSVLSPQSSVPLRLSDGLVLLSLRPRHDGAGLIIRFWDALGLPREATIELDGPISAVRRCDLMERPQQQLPLVSLQSAVGSQQSGLLPEMADTTNRLLPTAYCRLDIAPHAVETLLVEFT